MPKLLKSCLLLLAPMVLSLTVGCGSSSETTVVGPSPTAKVLTQEERDAINAESMNDMIPNAGE